MGKGRFSPPTLRICLVLALHLLGPWAYAQPSGLPAPVLKLLQDSALMGSPVRMTLHVAHAPKQVVFFADSGGNYAPFEFRSKDAYPTRVRGGQSIDSAEYTLINFGIEPEVRLSLPVFYLLPGGDTLPVYSNQLSGSQAATDSLLVAINPLEVTKRLNYPYIGLAVAGVLGLLLLVNIVFGRPIERYFKLLLLSRRHSFYVKGFDRLVEQIMQTKQPALMEKALNLWKNYLERLEDVPYSTYTTRDFTKEMPDSSLTKSLETIDRWVYGGFPPEKIESVFGSLKRYSIRSYSQKRLHMRDAKNTPA